MEPLADELLNDPIRLQSCPGLTIVEWRSTPGLELTTGPSSVAIAAIEEACARTVAALAPFLHERGYGSAEPPEPIDYRLSLLPAAPAAGGMADRALNDLVDRFHNPRIPGSLRWGITDGGSHYIYVRNDVLVGDPPHLRRDFASTLTHELAHAVTFRLRIPVGGDYGRANEELVIAFESSLLWDDLPDGDEPDGSVGDDGCAVGASP